MSKKLPNSFKDDLPRVKYFEYEFHSANYHLQIEVLTALRTVAGHLTKALESPETESDLKKATILDFMHGIYESTMSMSDVMREIGIVNASTSHLRCLAKLPLTATYSCLKLFFHWVDDGFYDFCMLPFHLKVHLESKDQLEIENLHTKWHSTPAELTKGLQELVDVLKHSEHDIAKRVNEAEVRW